ncbi:MAG TPA: CPXCG motif-containing cysteine-rich protein, partial [Gemmatimonadetes bacterium]|nr:CPXCG motif-containing cysteine-rich protein [Gemmatimonadota bacterium]
MDHDVFGSHDEFGADLDHSEQISCPYCGESCELPIDLVGGARQEYVHDCE